MEWRIAIWNLVKIPATYFRLSLPFSDHEVRADGLPGVLAIKVKLRRKHFGYIRYIPLFASFLASSIVY